MSGRAPAPPGASRRAFVVGRTISELMNAKALGLVAGIVAVALWVVARGRAGKAAA